MAAMAAAPVGARLWVRLPLLALATIAAGLAIAYLVFIWMWGQLMREFDG